MKKSIEQIQIENLSKKRYEYFAMDFPDWDTDKEAELCPPEIQKEIDDLADQILDSIKRWRNALPFEVIFEELTKLGWAPCLLYDDDGHFAISGEGMQSIPMDEKQEVGTDWISHWVQPDGWKDSIREALNYYLDEEDKD